MSPAVLQALPQNAEGFRGVVMRRIMIVVFIALMAAGAVFAQTPPEKITISGNLGISQGFISLESGGQLYYVMGLQRFTGFIDGLKAGAPVTLEGYVIPPRNYGWNLPPAQTGIQGTPYFFRALTLNLGGKNYDLSPPAVVRGNFRQQDFMCPGPWGAGPRGRRHR
jgi:hypothetical protein